MKPARISSFLVIGLFLIAALPAQANTGRVVTMSGDVKINGRTMSKISAVREGDRITTGDDSHVNIVMSDRSVLDIRENTRFQLERYSFNKNRPEQGSSLMNLLRGSFRYISGLVGRTNHANARIRMGTATAGVRGSYASFDYDGEKAVIDVSLGKLTVKLADGQTITIEKRKNGATSSEKSASVVVDKGEVGTIYFSAKKGEIKDNPDPDLAMKAAVSILKDSSPDAVKAALEGMSDADKAMVVAVMVANQGQLGAGNNELAAAVSAVTATKPGIAPLLAAVATTVAKDGKTAASLIDAMKAVKGVDGDAVDKAAKEAGKFPEYGSPASTGTGPGGGGGSPSTPFP